MVKYLGVKLILATLMTHGEYSKEKYGESTNSEFSIQNKDTEGYKVVYEDGYISWSPKEAFEKAYRPITDMTFGLAIEAMKKGNRVARRGWNGKGMFLYLVPENSYPAQTEAAKQEFGDMVPYGAYIAMKTAQGNVIPWLASQADVLAEDWYIVD